MDKLAAYELILSDHPLWEKKAGIERLGKEIETKKSSAPSTFGVYELPDRLRGHFKITHNNPVLIELTDRDIDRLKQSGFALPKRVSPEVEEEHWKARAKGMRMARP
jgi:hypothetical protein